MGGGADRQDSRRLRLLLGARQRRHCF